MDSWDEGSTLEIRGKMTPSEFETTLRYLLN